MVRLSDIKHLPKIELHRHIEGAMRPETLREFAAKKQIDNYPYQNASEFKKVVTFEKNHAPDFLYFLSKFINVWYSSLDDVERVAYECVEDVYNEGVLYYELRCSPEHYAIENNYPRDKVLSRILSGIHRFERGHKDIKVKLLLTFNRMKQSAKEMLSLLDMLKDFKNEGVVGVDLAGDEINYPAKDFAKVFEEAKKSGFKVTIHAGEAVGPFSIWDSINYLLADRIGHGVASIQDEKLIEYLIENKIALEQCFTSNILTGAVKDIKTHPFPKLYEAGVPVTICTDDPTIQQSTLNDDYYIASKEFKFSFEDYKKVNLNAIDLSFLDDKDKDALRKRYIKKFDAAVSEMTENSGV